MAPDPTSTDPAADPASTDPASTDPATLADLLASAAREEPDAVALVETGARARALTWAQLDAEVDRVAAGLAVAGVVAGYRVLLALGNRAEFVAAYLGTLRAQAVAVPVNPRATGPEVAHVLADAAPRLAVADAGALPALREAVAELAAARPDAVLPRVVALDAEPAAGERAWSDLLAAPPRAVPAVRDPERPAALLYTSGTTGRPRGAMLSHRALLANVEQLTGVEPPMVRPDDVVLGVLPLFHVYGLNAVLGAVLRLRARLVLVERFDPVGTLGVVAEHGCTVLPLAPAVFAQWREVPDLRERLAGVRLVLSGSAPLAAEVVDDVAARTGHVVHQGYGLTEAAPVVTSTLASPAPRPGSVGAPLPGIELRLVGPDGVLPPRSEEAGEVEVRGANLFSGYWPDGADGPDPDGWWGTGDVGYLEDGDLTLVDRLGELVIVSGFNVYPAEVEDAVRATPGVAETAVIGVPDELTGQAVVAYVRPAPGAPGAADLAAAVLATCAGRLARFKRPSRVEVVPELPLTVTGKVQRGRLRAVERRRATRLLEPEPEPQPQPGPQPGDGA